MTDWANLPIDLLGLITQRLASLDDFTVFSAVCKSWQSASFSFKEKIVLPPRIPRLVLAEDQNSNQSRRLFSLSTSKTYEIQLPEASAKNCMGANYGWLWTLGRDLQINLFHPFSGKQIPLPHMLAFTDQYNYRDDFKAEDLIDMFVTKVALSSNPWGDNEQEWVVAAIYGEFRILAFARPGNQLWTDIRCPSRCYEDIIYYKGKFYAVDCHGIVVVCDIDDHDHDGPRATVIAPAPSGTRDSIQKYLVESSGDLLLVSRKRRGLQYEVGDDDTPRYYTTGFSVLKLEKCNAGEEARYPFSWTGVNSLGDRALFLGRNPSVSLSALEFNGCFKANCIYYTDDNVENYFDEPGGGGRDMGIYNMENWTIEPHFVGVSRSPISPPFWYL